MTTQFTLRQLVDMAAADNIVGFNPNASSFLFFDSSGAGYFVVDGVRQDPGVDIPIFASQLNTSFFVQADSRADYVFVRENVPGELYVPLVLGPNTQPPGQGPTIGIVAADADRDEGDSGATPFTFTVSRSGITNGTHSVTWTVSPGQGPGANGLDFVGGAFPTGTVTFGPNETARTVTVTIQGDTMPESDDTFVVTLSNATNGATIDPAHPRADGRIRNDDAAPADDHPGDSSTGSQVPPGGSGNGNIGTPADRDWFRTQFTAGLCYEITLEGSDTGAGTLGDPYLRIYDGLGQLLAEDDDSGVGFNSQLVFCPAVSGAYFIGAGAYNDGSTGTYMVHVTALRPDDDILWRHSSGAVMTWEMEDGGVLGNHVLANVPLTWQIAGTGDFDADGDADVLWRHQEGAVLTWEMENGAYVANHGIAFASTGWEIVNTGDFDADGDSDVLWRHREGAVVTWEMESGAYVENHNIAFASTGWRIDGLGDFDADGDADVIWRHREGAVVTWEMEDGAYVVNHNIEVGSTSWQIQGTGDFDGDGDDDILWRHREGAVVTWEMENGAYVSNHSIAVVSTGWRIEGSGDFDADGDDDILWRHADGGVVSWQMDGGDLLTARHHTVMPNNWQIAHTGDFDLA
jgi:hypothetical protein